MGIYSLYFSPTGGVKKVLDILEEEMRVDSNIDLSKQDTNYSEYSLKKDDVCFIGMPVFGGRVPSIALERLRKIKVDGALAVVVAVFGNRAYDDALLEMKNEAAACGFVVGAAIAANAEHSIMRKFGHSRPDIKDREDLIDYAKKIKNLIENKSNIKSFEVPGKEPYKVYNGVPMKPKANNSCTKCGACAKQCPVGAIPKDNPSSLDENKCISCMRCIKVCPENARKISKIVLFIASHKMKKLFKTRKDNELYM